VPTVTEDIDFCRDQSVSRAIATEARIGNAKERTEMWCRYDADVQERRVCWRFLSIDPACGRVRPHVMSASPPFPRRPGGRGEHGSIGRAQLPTTGTPGARHRGVFVGAWSRRLLRAIGRPGVVSHSHDDPWRIAAVRKLEHSPTGHWIVGMAEAG
jgi:hypothetical protein